MLRFFRTARPLPILVSLVILALAGGGIAFAAAQHQPQPASNPESQNVVGTVPPGGQSVVDVGLPGITPTRPAADAATASGNYVAGTTYTAGDVQSFLAANPGTFLGYTGKLKIDSISFLSKAQAALLVHSTLDGQVPDGGMVCYVRASGSFRGGAAISSPFPPVNDTPYTSAWLLFDGMTGNILSKGIVP